MKERIRINVSVQRDYVGDWRTVARAALDPFQPLEVQTYPFGFRFIFGDYPETIEQVRAFLKARGIDTSLSVKREYSDEELLAAEFLDFGTEAVVKSVAGTLRWDLVLMCPHCKFQEIRWDLQKLRIKDKAEAYKLARVDWHPEVVSAPLAEAIRLAGFTGLELVPVGEDIPPAWFGLQVIRILPPMQSPPTRLRWLLGTTSLCERNHNLERPHSEFYYRRTGFEALDFNHTYEVFGSSGAGARAVVISNRVYRLLVELGVKQLACEPIRFIEYPDC